MSQQPELLGHWPAGDLPASAAWSLPRLWWLNVFLLFCTAITTTVFGYTLVAAFDSGRPFREDDLVNSFRLFLHLDPRLLHGLTFSLPLLLILMAHEMGHYIACLKCNVDATLPVFMPSPTLFGTLGAFIRIKTPIYTRRDLFDIGAAGPIAGFITLIPILFAGVWLSRPLPLPNQEALLVATPLGLRALEILHFGMAGSSHILLHPMAVAALAGMLVTALNLLPLGQLDGGHIVYAVLGERRHKIIATCVVAALLLMGKFYFPWWGWAIFMFFFGRRHPLVYDDQPLDAPRRWFAFATLLIFVLSFSLAPTSGLSL